MDFRLNDYHKNLSRDELIIDLIKVSNQLGKLYISRTEYESNGQFSASPYLRCFGSWINALSAAGLKTQRTKKDYIRIPTQSIIEDMKRVSAILDKDSITTKDYTNNGKYKVQTILLRFGSWREALIHAELKPTTYKEISNLDLFEEIERLWINKGSQPTTTDIKNGLSKYSLNTYSRRFGGWRNALKSFLEYVDGEYKYTEKTNIHNNENVYHVSHNEKVQKHLTSRDPNLKLRFKVLKRDNFKCCMCVAGRQQLLPD